MRAWLFEDHRQKRRLGAEKCPWSVGWLDPEGKRRSKRIGSRSMAEKFRRKKEGELAAGTYQAETRKQWKDFREDYEASKVAALAPKTRRCISAAMDHFERIIKPGRVMAIKTQTIDRYISQRRKEPGKKAESTVSPASINKELRHLKAVLRVAHDWGYLPKVPKVAMLKEPQKLPRFVTPEDFAKLYEACKVATRPQSTVYTAADWWRAMLTFCYLTGWRVGEPLALRWDDVSLDEGWAITRHEENKGNRDEKAPLHPIVIEHLRKLVDFGPMVFSWPHHERTLWVDFAKIQEAAGIHLPCHEKHEHTDACHLYGFHDLRRAFATQNAPRLTGDALQALMRHKSYLTTKRYINMARQLDGAIERLHVPDFLRDKTAE